MFGHGNILKFDWIGRLEMRQYSSVPYLENTESLVRILDDVVLDLRSIAILALTQIRHYRAPMVHEFAFLVSHRQRSASSRRERSARVVRLIWADSRIGHIVSLLMVILGNFRRPSRREKIEISAATKNGHEAEVSQKAKLPFRTISFRGSGRA